MLGIGAAEAAPFQGRIGGGLKGAGRPVLKGRAFKARRDEMKSALSSRAEKIEREAMIFGVEGPAGCLELMRGPQTAGPSTRELIVSRSTHLVGMTGIRTGRDDVQEWKRQVE